jgi:molybdopterin converting factor small subunit
LKDWLGAPAAQLELPEGATVAALLNSKLRARPAAASVARHRGQRECRIRDGAHVLRDGDEVGLLPPVSGGSARRNRDERELDTQRPLLTREPD